MVNTVGSFWPHSPVSPKQSSSQSELNARQRKQVYSAHASHFVDGCKLAAPDGQASPVIYDPVHQLHLLEITQANARLTTPARVLPAQALLPSPRDMRVTTNAGHGVVFPTPQSWEASTVPLADARIRRTETACQLQRDCLDTQSNTSSSKENRNLSDGKTMGVQQAAPDRWNKRMPQSPRDDLTEVSGTTDILRVIRAAPCDGAIPNEFSSLSTNLSFLDTRAELCNSPRKRQSNIHNAAERKQMNLSSSECFGKKSMCSSPSSPRKLFDDKEFWQDCALANWPTASQCFAPTGADENVARFTDLVDACKSHRAPGRESYMRSTSASQRKAIVLEASLASPFRRRSSSQCQITENRSLSLSARESPRRRSETNFSDLFGRETPSRPLSPGSSRSQFADTSLCGLLDMRVELSNRRGMRKEDSTRRRIEKNYSDLFDSRMPERLSTQRQRSHSPEAILRDEETSCWASRDRAGFDPNAELSRRLKERLLRRVGAMPPQKACSAAERKRLDLSSGSMRSCIGDTPREWDDGRVGPGPAPKAITMRMRSVPDHKRFRQRHGSPARERYMASVLTSDAF